MEKTWKAQPKCDVKMWHALFANILLASDNAALNGLMHGAKIVNQTWCHNHCAQHAIAPTMKGKHSTLMEDTVALLPTMAKNESMWIAKDVCHHCGCFEASGMKQNLKAQELHIEIFPLDKTSQNEVGFVTIHFSCHCIVALILVFTEVQVCDAGHFLVLSATLWIHSFDDGGSCHCHLPLCLLGHHPLHQFPMGLSGTPILKGRDLSHLISSTIHLNHWFLQLHLSCTKQTNEFSSSSPWNDILWFILQWSHAHCSHHDQSTETFCSHCATNKKHQKCEVSWFLCLFWNQNMCLGGATCIKVQTVDAALQTVAIEELLLMHFAPNLLPLCKVLMTCIIWVSSAIECHATRWLKVPIVLWLPCYDFRLIALRYLEDSKRLKTYYWLVATTTSS